MQLHSIKKWNFTTSRRVGRGGKRGKTSGRGGKGQTARAGNKPRPEWRDIIKKYPKRRGYGKNRSRTVVPGPSPVAINLDMLSTLFKDGDVVSGRSLFSKGAVRRVSGRIPRVKILATGILSKKLSFKDVLVSVAAIEKIEKSGGTIKTLNSKL